MVKNRIKKDSIEALKSGEKKKVEILRFLISLIDKKELKLPLGQMKEADEIGVLRKELKNKEESREMFLKAERKELVEELDKEIVIVKEYLPKDISEEDIIKVVEKVIAEQGNNFGLIMKESMAELNGAVDGGIISKIVKEKISS
jgi:uncharacterized protein